MNIRLNIIFFSWLLITCVVNSWATEFQSPRVAALGGAGRASPLSTDAIYINPSFIPQIPLHVLSVNYLSYHGSAQNYYDTSGRVLNAAFQDGSKGSYFQAGVGYTKFTHGTMIHGAVAAELSQNLSLGVSVKALRPQYEVSDLKFNGSVSMTWILSKNIRAAVIGDNVLRSAMSQNLLRELTLATKFGFSQDLGIFIDPHWYPDLGQYPESFGFEAGIEYFVSEVVCLRAGGYRNSKPNFQSERTNGLGGGLGLVFPRTAIDYSYSRQLGNPRSGFAHNVALSLYF
jgi:hypothetical protein